MFLPETLLNGKNIVANSFCFAQKPNNLILKQISALKLEEAQIGSEKTGEIDLDCKLSCKNKAKII